MLTAAADVWSGLLLTDGEEDEPELLLMVTGWKVTEGPPSNWGSKYESQFEIDFNFASIHC